MSPRDDYYTSTEDDAARFEAAHTEYDDRPSLADCAPQDFIDEAAGPDPWQRCCNTPEQAAARLCGCKGEPYV